MLIAQFFNKNPNFVVLEAFKAILRSCQGDEHVILEVHLVPQGGCKCFQNREVRICLKKLTYKHILYADNKKLSTP